MCIGLDGHGVYCNIILMDLGCRSVHIRVCKIDTWERSLWGHAGIQTECCGRVECSVSVFSGALSACKSIVYSNDFNISYDIMM